MHHGKWTFWCAYWKDYGPFSFAQDIRIEFSNCVCSTAFFFALIEYKYVCIWLHINFIRRLLMHKRTTSTTKITTVNIIDLWEQYTNLSFSLSLYNNIELDNANNSLLYLVRVSFFPCHMYWILRSGWYLQAADIDYFFFVCAANSLKEQLNIFMYTHICRKIIDACNRKNTHIYVFSESSD